MTYRITVVSAGLRSPSTTELLAESLARQVVSAFEAVGAHAATTHIALREHGHAIVDALLTGFPTGELREAVRATTDTDALIVVTPTFSASYSGLFKSYFDIIEREELRGLPVLMAATGGTERHSLVLEYALRPLFSYLGTSPIRTGVFAATSDFGGATSADLTGRIATAAVELRDSMLGAGPRGGLTPADSVTPFAELLGGGRPPA